MTPETYTPKTVYTTYIKAPAERIWEALTSSEISPQFFFGRRVESDWKLGSVVNYWQEDGTLDVTGKVAEVDYPRRLSFTWHVEWLEEFRHLPEVLVTFEIEPQEDDTMKLTMIEAHRAEVDPKLLEGGRRGWSIILNGLKTLLETGAPMPTFIPEAPKPTDPEQVSVDGFVYVAYIATTPERVWEALTSSELSAQYWGGYHVDSDWKVGSPFTLWGPDGEVGDTGVILESDPPRRLSYTWRVEAFPQMREEGFSRVAFDIEPLGELVRLTLTHDQFPTPSLVRDAVSNGWPALVAGLKSMLETGRLPSSSSVAAGKAAKARIQAKLDGRTPA